MLPRFVLQPIIDIVFGRTNEMWNNLHLKQKLIRIDGNTTVFRAGMVCPALGGNVLYCETTHVDGAVTMHRFTCEETKNSFGLEVDGTDIEVVIYPNAVIARMGYLMKRTGELKSKAEFVASLSGEHPSLRPFGRINYIIGDGYIKKASTVVMGELKYYPCGDEDHDMFTFKTKRAQVVFNLNADGKLHSNSPHVPAIRRYEVDDESMRCTGAIYALNGVAMPETEHARQLDRVLYGLPGPIYEEVSENMPHSAKMPIMRNGRRYIEVTSW